MKKDYKKRKKFVPVNESLVPVVGLCFMIIFTALLMFMLMNVSIR